MKKLLLIYILILLTNNCFSQIEGQRSKSVSYSSFLNLPLNAFCNGAPVLCHGYFDGTACISATGGTPPYSYSWNSGSTTSCISGVSGGIYCVTVTDGTSATATCCYTVTEPPALSVSCSGTNVSCNGGNNGTICATASGGTVGYQYDWSNGATGSCISGLAAGPYCVTVVDAIGCTASCCYTINQLPALSASSFANVNVTCNGGSNGCVSVAVSGGTPPYSGTGVFCGLAAGSFQFIVTDSYSCTVSATVTITQPLAITATVTSNSPVCLGSLINITSAVSGGTGSKTYLWSGPNGFGSTAANPVITNAIISDSGIYTVTITDAHGCTGTASTHVQVGCTQIEEPSGSASFSIYPNPPGADGKLMISFNGILHGPSIKIFNLLGEVVYFTDDVGFSSKEKGEATIQINLHVPAGIYFVQVWDGERQYVEKIMVNN
jgi:hypothetical protein